MPRVQFPPVESLSPAYREALLSRPPLNLYRMLPRTGVLAPLFLQMGAAIRNDLQLSPRLREIAIVRVGILTGAAYEVHHHKALALRCGVTEEELEATVAGDTFPLGGDEALVVRYTDALVQTVRADDALFQELSEAIGVDAVAELTLAIGFYLLVSRFLTNFDIEIEQDFQHSTWS